MVKRSFGSSALLPLAEGRGITIETNGEVATTIGAPALLLPMTTNLVHNAIVHTSPTTAACGSRPAFNPRARHSPWRTPATSSAPNWLPRSPNRSDAARDVFTQTTPVSAWGLAIVERIAEAHDGTMTLAARPEGGLCVTVRLPIAPE